MQSGPSSKLAAIVGGLALTGSVLVATPAEAAEPATKAIRSIEAVAPDVLLEVAVSRAVDVPTDPEEPITVKDDPQAGSGGLQIGVPFADTADDAVTPRPGVRFFDNNNGSSTVPVTHDDASVQLLTVIGNASAPTRYDYQLHVPPGATATLDHGGVFITEANGDLAGMIAPAWAKDAQGAAVPTHSEFIGDTLTQIVEHSSAFAYPIVADPYLGVKMVQNVTWVKRDKRGRTLVVTPTRASRAFGGAYLAGVYGWKEVEARAGRQNVQMQWQYICHQQFAFAKATYNLDTWWRRANYPDVVNHRCN